MSLPLSLMNALPAQLSTPAPNSRGVHASRDFEASLIASLLQAAEKTFAALPGEDSFAGAENYDFMATQALGAAITARGGFGIADMISRYLAAHGDHK
jgi:Rod binding domain-containing protein